MNTKKYQYILFDWDGCLAKTLDIWLKAYRIAYGEYGVHPTDQEIAHHFGDWEAPKYYGITDIEGCFNKIDAIASKDLKKVDLYEGAKQVLDNLKMAKNLALLSSSPREIIKAAALGRPKRIEAFIAEVAADITRLTGKFPDVKRYIIKTAAAFHRDDPDAFIESVQRNIPILTAKFPDLPSHDIETVAVCHFGRATERLEEIRAKRLNKKT